MKKKMIKALLSLMIILPYTYAKEFKLDESSYMIGCMSGIEAVLAKSRGQVNHKIMRQVEQGCLEVMKKIKEQISLMDKDKQIL
jgi:fatty acid/phospholipid biosynthesis enzyme